MSILNKVKTNAAKFAIAGMIAVSAMGPVAASMPTQVYAAETTVVGKNAVDTSHSYTDTIAKGELQEIIDNAELTGSLISKSDNSFVLKTDGTTVEVSYKDAGSIHLTENSHYENFCNHFGSSTDAYKKFIKKMQITDAEVIWYHTPQNSTCSVVGNLPLVKVTYNIIINQ